MHLKDIAEFKDAQEARKYFDCQENMLLECLKGINQMLKPGDIKTFVPELARCWKRYLHMAGISQAERQYAAVHCAGLLRLRGQHKYSFDYHETINDPNHVKLGLLESHFKQQSPKSDDLVLVRDLRI